MGDNRTSLAAPNPVDWKMQVAVPPLCSTNAAFQVFGNLFPAVEEHGSILGGDELAQSGNNFAPFVRPEQRILSAMGILRHPAQAELNRNSMMAHISASLKA